MSKPANTTKNPSAKPDTKVADDKAAIAKSKADQKAKDAEALQAKAKEAEDKAAIAKAKADQKAKDDEAKAEAKVKKDAEAAAKKAEKEAEKAAKAAAKKAEADAKAAKLEEGKAAREEALAKIGSQQVVIDDLNEKLAEAKRQMSGLRQMARIPGIKGNGSTAVLRDRASTYTKDKEHKTASGNTSIHCNDETANKLLGKSIDECYAIAGKVCAPDLDEAALRAKYSHLNVGMQRMNLGNKIRGILNAK